MAFRRTIPRPSPPPAAPAAKPEPMRSAGSAAAVLVETCEVCCDLLFVGAHVAKDDKLFCNETCRRQWHRMKRRVLWETHTPWCMCVDCYS